MPASASPTPPHARTVENPLSLVAVETAIARSAAGFGIAFLLQSVPTLLAQAPNLRTWWVWAAAAGLAAVLLAATAAAIVGRLVRVTSAAVAVWYLLALATWPLAVVEVDAAAQESFWLYYTLTVATVMATIGLPVRGAIAYLILVPALYALLRTLPAGGGIDPLLAVLDSLYSILLGGVVTVISTILRSTARSVDRAQRTALERYSHAVRHHATEAERVQVDAIVHDSVLTTLLSAARAYTPEAKELAATMAANAIGHLRDASRAEPGGASVVSAVTLARRIHASADTMSQPFEVRQSGLSGITVPIAAAEAVHSASVQAMVNSLQHAGRATRWITMAGTPDGGIEVEIGDDGAGFAYSEVPTERLGVRVSIVERLAGAGGRATVDSAPGAGTRISLRWPDHEAAIASALDDIVAVLDDLTGRQESGEDPS